MHEDAFLYVQNAVKQYGPFQSVVEFGGLDVNETVLGFPIKKLFDTTDYHSIDLRDGPAVTEVANCATWRTNRLRDVVLCCEVFEHTTEWREIIESASLALKPNGIFIMTCAGEGRNPHGATGTIEVLPGEHYANINKDELELIASKYFKILDINHHLLDLQMVAMTNA